MSFMWTHVPSTYSFTQNLLITLSCEIKDLHFQRCPDHFYMVYRIFFWWTTLQNFEQMILTDITQLGHSLKTLSYSSLYQIYIEGKMCIHFLVTRSNVKVTVTSNIKLTSFHLFITAPTAKSWHPLCGALV